MSFGIELKVVGRTGKILKVNTPPAAVVTGSPESVTVTVTGPGAVKLFAKRRMRAPVEGGLVTVPVGIGNRILTWPLAELIGVTPLCASVSVICEAEERFGALR